MTKINHVQFFENAADNNSCFQACLKMVLKYYLPNENYSWLELDRVTAKKQGLWTWPMAGLVWMQENNFKVINIELFDYKEFIDNPERYLIDYYGEEVGHDQIKNSDIEQGVKFSKKLIEVVEVENRSPNFNDIKKLINDGYLIIVNVNSSALDGYNGYTGHFVVVIGFDNFSIYLNDPGLPGQSNRQISLDVFKKAWSYPDSKANNVMAFKIL